VKSPRLIEFMQELPRHPTGKLYKRLIRDAYWGKEGSVSANAAAKQIRGKGLAGKGQEIHHTIPLRGLSRTAQDPRNHYALLKVLPVEQHRRLTGSWKGAPRYDPVRRVWYGTTDWQKALPTAAAANLADGVQNLFQQRGSPRR